MDEDTTQWQGCLNSTDMAGLRGMCQVIHNHFGRTKNALATPVAGLIDLQDGVIRLGRVVVESDGLMLVRIKRLTDTLLDFDAVLVQQPAHLLQG